MNNMNQAAVVTRKDIDEILGVLRDFMGMTQIQFDKIDQRFEQVDERFEQVDRRFEQVDQRFEQIDRRFECVDQRFERMDQRLETIERDIRHINMELSAMQQNVALTQGEQQATRNDLKEFYSALTKLDKKVERYHEMNTAERNATWLELERLKEWAHQIGERAGHPFPMLARPM